MVRRGGRVCEAGFLGGLDVPFQAIFDRVADGSYQAKPAHTFRFEEIQDAHRLMEASQANGKIVVTV